MSDRSRVDRTPNRTPAKCEHGVYIDALQAARCREMSSLKAAAITMPVVWYCRLATSETAWHPLGSFEGSVDESR